MDSSARQRAAASEVAILIDRGLTLSVAESVTGGAFCALLSQVPGVSAVLIGGAVVYSAQAKIELAGIDPAILAQYSTVAAETSMALARGIRQRLHTDIGMGVTGNAGPSTEGEDGVGVVYWAISGRWGEQSHLDIFDGDRDHIQQAAVFNGLAWLHEYLGLTEGSES